MIADINTALALQRRGDMTKRNDRGNNQSHRGGVRREWSFENYPEGNNSRDYDADSRAYNSQQNTSGYRDTDGSHYQSQSYRDYDDNRERNARNYGEQWNNQNNSSRGTESMGYSRDYSRTGAGDYYGRNGYFSESTRDTGSNQDESFGDKVRRFFGKGPKGYKRSDERIREDVCDHLSAGWIDASDIEVSVSEGEVTLSGTVTERRMKHVADWPEPKFGAALKETADHGS